jgi:hypothetical protein
MLLLKNHGERRETVNLDPVVPSAAAGLRNGVP